MNSLKTLGNAPRYDLTTVERPVGMPSANITGNGKAIFENNKHTSLEFSRLPNNYGFAVFGSDSVSLHNTQGLDIHCDAGKMQDGEFHSTGKFSVGADAYKNSVNIDLGPDHGDVGNALVCHLNRQFGF